MSYCRNLSCYDQSLGRSFLFPPLRWSSGGLKEASWNFCSLRLYHLFRSLGLWPPSLSYMYSASPTAHCTPTRPSWAAADAESATSVSFQILMPAPGAFRSLPFCNWNYLYCHSHPQTSTKHHFQVKSWWRGCSSSCSPGWRCPRTSWRCICHHCRTRMCPGN